MNVHEFLDQRQVPYETIDHIPTFDAQRLAQAVDEIGSHIAKTVLLKTDTGYLLAVLPATHAVDLAGARAMLKADHVDLASEEELSEQFPDCEKGVVSPFGSQYGMTTLVDESLTSSKEIVFESDTHDEAIRMQFADYFELEKPVIVEISRSSGL